ncbi:fructose-bisphosphatase [Helicobacter sp. 12S02634-8]|uniref:class 1 fructose-bisphosphatase n=1 Tax=Helicobacter sp. 12S02634-8 TaxID=1476199 RepID=UPI000BA70AAD|nr:class 1 fructose-bisphosphatase [Helicobacter sp. 12S02634-8]PAF47769.1 fructose-bisphosphatase [Helicobacter sp. 12S02634-8]
MSESFIPTLQKCALQIQELLKATPTHYLDSTNASGDQQLGVDVKADCLIEKELLDLEFVCGICSEEKSEAILRDQGTFLVAYDPLDGSSIIDANLSVGSIFGFYAGAFAADKLIGAAYIIYGPRLEIVFASTTLIRYTYHRGKWEQAPLSMLQKKGKINAPGGTQKHWSPSHKKLIDSLFDEGYRLRYSGGMVPDLHHILIKGGGLFSYPQTSDSPKGKLRKLFEVFPFAFIYEKAGGAAIDGKRRLLELEIQSLHESTPCFFGSVSEIQKVKESYE